MSEDSQEEEKNLIKHTGPYGVTDIEAKNWDDFDEFGKEGLLNRKIVKIKIYTGTYSNMPAIFGFSCVFKNLFTGENEAEKEYKGSEQFEDYKEFKVPGGEYLTDFHIRFPDQGDYLTQIGFETNKKTKILVGTKEGNDKIIKTNGGENIIIGTFGHFKKNWMHWGF